MQENLINVDYFKRVYYKAILPLDNINRFLQDFNKQELEEITQILISILDVSITDMILDKLESIDEKTMFIRMCQDNYSNPEILDHLIDKFPNIEELIEDTIDRSIFAAESATR